MDEFRLALQASVLEKKQMREALEFYGDINNFRTFDSPAVKDYGKKARQALGLVVGS